MHVWPLLAQTWQRRTVGKTRCCAITLPETWVNTCCEATLVRTWSACGVCVCVQIFPIQWCSRSAARKRHVACCQTQGRSGLHQTWMNFDQIWGVFGEHWTRFAPSKQLRDRFDQPSARPGQFWLSILPDPRSSRSSTGSARQQQSLCRHNLDRVRPRT